MARARRDKTSNGFPLMRGREVEAWFKLAEEHALSNVAPSKLCWPIAAKYVTLGLDIEPSSPTGIFCLMAVTMGYAARIAAIERRSDLSPWSEIDIADLTIDTKHGRIDLGALKSEGFDPRYSEHINDWMASRFADPEAILEIASCTPGIWEGLTSWAVLNIHGNMLKNSARPGDLPPSELDALMRLGYLLRCLDEALGEEPGDLATYSG